MTIRECVQTKLKRVRRPDWEPSAYMALPDSGPWATLYEFGQEQTKLGLWELGGDDWEAAPEET